MKNNIVILVCLISILAGCKTSGPKTTKDNASGLLLVANKGNHTLSIIDPITGRQIAAVDEEGVTGHEVVASSDGRWAFVPIFGNSGVGKPGTDGSVIRVIDIAEGKIADTIDFHRGVRPHCAVIGPQDALLYVTTELENSIAVIDPKTLQQVGTIPTGQAESHMLAITSDGKHGYASNVGPGTVSVLDLQAQKLLAVIPVGGHAQRIALSPDNRWVFTSDQTQPRLAVIDTQTNGIAYWIEMPGLGYGTAATPDGRWLVVALPKLNQVGVIDLRESKLVRTLDVPASPQEVLIRPDGAEAYVSCDVSGKIAAIDLRNWQVRLVQAGPGADGLAWAKRE